MHHMCRWLADDLHIGRAGLTDSWEYNAVSVDSGINIYVAEMLRSIVSGVGPITSKRKRALRRSS